MDAATWRQRARYTDDGGVAIAYRVDGDDGAPVLLIMGLAMPGRAWQRQVEGLAHLHPVATFDNRGVGDSGRARGPYTMAQLADDARRVLDALGWPTAHVVGVSMGGMVAQELALGSRDRVRSLTLIATHAGGLRALPPHALGLLRFAKAQVGGRAARGQALEELLFPRPYLERCDRAALRRTLTDDLGDPPPAATRTAQLAAVLRHRTRERLARLSDLPTLLVRPGLDVLVRPSEVDRLHRLLPHARLLRLDDAGHGVIRQSPERLNLALMEHFSAADGALPAP